MSPQEQAEEERLAALRSLDLLDTPPEERFDRVTKLCTRLFGVPMAMVTLVDRDRQFHKSKVGVDLDDLDRRHSFCSVALDLPAPLVVEDASEDDRFAANPLVTGDPNIRFYAGQPLQAPGGHRVGALCILDSRPRELSPTDRALLADVALWVEKEMAIEEELEKAAEVQRGLLPRNDPDIPGWDIAGACIPSREVGGDLYDWYRTPTGLVVTVADVMGKGMPAAIMMATLRATLRAASRTGTVADAVGAAAAVMDEDFGDTGAFATVFHSRVFLETGEVRFVDAGHGLALLRRADGTSERVIGGGLPVGPVPDESWELDELQLGPGDCLAICSDGILDLHADLPAAVAAMSDALDTPSASAAVDRLLRDARQGRPDDDCTAAVIRRPG